MKIATGTLFLALSVFLNSAVFISPIRTALKTLFPGFDGINFPPIKKLEYQLIQHCLYFRSLGHRQMSDPTAKTFLARGNIVVGWKQGNDIKPLSILFDGYDAPIVFDKANDQWVTLSKEEFDQLGPNRSLPLVRAHEKLAAEYNLQASQHEYKGSQSIHLAASLEANLAAHKQEEIQTKLLHKGRGTYPSSALIVEQAFRKEYAQAYRRYSSLTKF